MAGWGYLSFWARQWHPFSEKSHVWWVTWNKSSSTWLQNKQILAQNVGSLNLFVMHVFEPQCMASLS